MSRSVASFLPLTLTVAIAVLAVTLATAAPQAPVGAPVRSHHVQGNVWAVTAGSVNLAVQVGDDGVLVVDTGPTAVADQVLAEIARLAGDKPIRYIVNTHAHPDHTGGNVPVAAAGRSVIAGNFVAQVGAAAANVAKVWAHENASARMVGATGAEPALPSAAWPTDTFFTARNDLYFNGEAVQMLHQPNAHTDGDIIVYFRKSDVIATGDVYINTTFPEMDLQQGGSFGGVIDALNRIIELTVPKDKQEGGTFLVPGHGRLADEADIVEYRDMLAIIRDRVAQAIAKGMTLEQVKAAGLVRDYAPRYGARDGSWTTDRFVEAVYRSLNVAQTRSREVSR